MKTLEFFDDNGWREDPDYSHAEWQGEVASDSTGLGYQAWVIAQHESNDIPYALPEGFALEDNAEPTEVELEAFPRENWLGEVEVLDTRLSYRDWVAHQVDAALEGPLADRQEVISSIMTTHRGP
jgi:hypothetical protein